MRRGLAIITVAILACALSGCSFTGVEESSSSAGESAPSTTESSPAPTVPNSPSPASETAPDATSADPVEEIPVTPETTAELSIDAEVTFLEAARAEWQGDDVADPVLLGLGNDACSELGAGKPVSDIHVIVDESGMATANNSPVVAAAAGHLCPADG